MKTFLAAALVSGATLLAPAGAFALDGCTCASMAVPGTKVLGRLVSASGAVQWNGAPAEIGATLSSGSTVATGSDAAASVEIGSCKVEMIAQSRLSVSQTGPDICVQLVEKGEFVSADRFAGVLPGEAEGMSTQTRQILQTDVTPAMVVLSTLVIGGVVWAIIEWTDDDDGPRCVSACGV